jgi:adenine-specific DNA-methyltransferase
MTLSSEVNQAVQVENPPSACSLIDRITRGDCIEVMKEMPAKSVDFVLTDPPYLVRYCDRSGRTVKNDNNDAWIDPAFAQMYRVLKDNSFCVSFYAWNKVGRFIEAWKKAGFHLAGHVVFTKRYSSSARFLEYQHEQAYLLAKGNPAAPDHPPPDVIRWTYTGNRLHPTQKPVSIFTPLLEAFTNPGDIVLDPFAGSGSTLVAAKDMGRSVMGIELDEVHHRTASTRLASKFNQPDVGQSRFVKSVVPRPMMSKFHRRDTAVDVNNSAPIFAPAANNHRPPVMNNRALRPRGPL